MEIARIFEFEHIDRLEELLRIVRELNYDESVQSPKLSGALLNFEIGLFHIKKVTIYSAKNEPIPPVVYKPKSEDQLDKTSRWYLKKYEVPEEDNAQVTKLADLENFLSTYNLDLYYFRTSTTIYEITPVQRVKSMFQSNLAKD